MRASSHREFKKCMSLIKARNIIALLLTLSLAVALALQCHCPGTHHTHMHRSRPQAEKSPCVPQAAQGQSWGVTVAQSPTMTGTTPPPPTGLRVPVLELPPQLPERHRYPNIKLGKKHQSLHFCQNKNLSFKGSKYRGGD